MVRSPGEVEPGRSAKGKESSSHQKSHVEIYRPDRKMDPKNDNSYELNCTQEKDNG